MREARVFDVYRGGQIPEGRKSVAVAVSFQAPDRTLSDDEAAGMRERIVAALRERFDAELRRWLEARSGDALGERLEHLDLHLRRARQQPAEVLLRHDQRPHGRCRLDGRRPRRLRDERDLAEEVTGSQRSDLPPLATDLGVAVEQNEELAPARRPPSSAPCPRGDRSRPRSARSRPAPSSSSGKRGVPASELRSSRSFAAPRLRESTVTGSANPTQVRSSYLEALANDMRGER